MVMIGATPVYQQLVLSESSDGQVMLNTQPGDLFEAPFDIDGGSCVYIQNHPAPVMADRRAFLWLHVAVMRNAGQTGGTPPLSIYSVHITLIPTS
jgi:hypothetical protein